MKIYHGNTKFTAPARRFIIEMMSEMEYRCIDPDHDYTLTFELVGFGISDNTQIVYIEHPITIGGIRRQIESHASMRGRKSAVNDMRVTLKLPPINDES